MEQEEEDVVILPELMLPMLSLLLEAMKRKKELLSLLQSIILQHVNNIQLFKYLPLKGVSLFSFL